METIKLKVTSKVLAQLERAGNQQQIAMSEPTGSLAIAIGKCSKSNRLKMRFGGSLSLEVGDTGAIWRAHNDCHKSNFDRLFKFLSEQPDIEFTFVCCVESQPVSANKVPHSDSVSRRGVCKEEMTLNERHFLKILNCNPFYSSNDINNYRIGYNGVVCL